MIPIIKKGGFHSRAETEMLVKGQRNITSSGGELTSSLQTFENKFSEENVEISNHEAFELKNAH